MLDRLVAMLDAGLGRRAATGDPPPPWLAWLVVALLRQRERQRWHRSVIETLSEASFDEEGDVPDHPGWRYHFHGIGCCLTGPDGEVLDVDARDGEAAVIDPWFFGRRVESVRAIGFVEGRLWRWLPSQKLVVVALADLERAGALDRLEGSHVFRLVEALEARATAVASEDFDDAATAARWRAVVETESTPEVTAAHHAWLVDQIVDGLLPYHALEGAIPLLSERELVGVCLRVIDGPPGAAAGMAIEALRARTPDARQNVRAFLDRLSPTEDPPYPAYQALAYLLERAADRAELVGLFQTFSRVDPAAGFRGNPFLGDYGALALRHLPELAMDLVRRALRSDTPVCVSRIAALLAAIDQPWCHRELAAALNGPPGPARAYVVEALRQSSGDLAAARAARGDLPPRSAPGQIGFSYEEILYNSVGTLFEPLLAEARPLADELRPRYPPDWRG